MNKDIVNVEEVLYETGPGEPIIGFNIFYKNGDMMPVGPVLLRHELDAIVKDAYSRGYREGAEQIRQDQALIDKHRVATTE